MSRKLQWFFDRFRSYSLFQVFGFFAIYYLLRIALGFIMKGVLNYWGYSEIATAQIIDNNEMFLQTGAILASLWCVFRDPYLSTKRFLLRELLGEQVQHWPLPRVWMASAISPLLWGFTWASLGVALSLLFGFVRIESGLSGAYWFYLLPALILRAIGIFFWVMALELMRLKLSRVMSPQKNENVLGASALVFFEASLLYAVFGLIATADQEIYMILMAAWIASLLVLWTLQTRNSVLASWRRVCWVAAFSVTLVCVYGIPMSWGRLPSLSTLHEGRPDWMDFGAPLPTFLGQWSFVLIFTFLAATAFYRNLIFKRTPKF